MMGRRLIGVPEMIKGENDFTNDFTRLYFGRGDHEVKTPFTRPRASHPHPAISDRPINNTVKLLELSLSLSLSLLEAVY
jgi:hypothetical protein